MNPPNGHDKDIVFSHPAGKYQVMRLLPNDPFTRELFPKLVDRAFKFVDTYDTGTDKIWLGNLLYSNFFNKTDLVHVLVALDCNRDCVEESDTGIVAHAISYVDTYQKIGPYVQVFQIEKDVAEPGIIEIGWTLMNEWARSLGLKVQMVSTTTEVHERFYQRFGFKRRRILMEREIPAQDDQGDMP